MVAAGALGAACSVAGVRGDARETESDTIADPSESSPAGIELFDASDLPEPVSTVATGDDRLVYFAQDSDPTHRLVQVAVDPDKGRVAWSAPAVPPFAPNGVGLYASVVGDLAFRFEEADMDEWEQPLVAVDVATGEERWRTTLPEPQYLPFDCDELLCVETAAGMVTVDPETGLLNQVGRAAQQRLEYSRVVGGSDDGFSALVVEVFNDGAVPAGRIIGTGSYGDKIEWTSDRNTLFDGASVTPDAGWWAIPTDAGWQVWLGATFAEDSADPVGALAGISPSGERLWTVPGDPCFSLEDLDLLLRCTVSEPAALDLPALVSSIDVLDPATGEARVTIPLPTPIDDSDPAGRLLTVDEHRFVVDTGERVLQVDIEAGTATEIPESEALGWCPLAPGEARLISALGLLESYPVWVGPVPCTLAGPLKLGDAAEAIISERLPSHTEVGSWHVWTNRHTIEGFRQTD